jgi:hypothetical protein
LSFLAVLRHRRFAVSPAISICAKNNYEMSPEISPEISPESCLNRAQILNVLFDTRRIL